LVLRESRGAGQRGAHRGLRRRADVVQIDGVRPDLASATQRRVSLLLQVRGHGPVEEHVRRSSASSVQALGRGWQGQSGEEQRPAAQGQWSPAGTCARPGKTERALDQ
jgi:hypothetical protein